MKKKVLLSESELVQLIENFLTENPNPEFRTFGMDLVGKSNEEKSNERKIQYFLNIFLPRFEEIKQVHGLNFTIELLNNLAIEVDEVNED
jgi:hypothetical protein